MIQTGSDASAKIGNYNDAGRDQINNNVSGDQTNYIFNNSDGSLLEQRKHTGAQTVLTPQLPPLTRTFVARKGPEGFIKRTLLGPRPSEDANESRMLVVTGMGGCGKTQLMLKFMKDHEAQFASRFFIDGSSEDRIRADITRNVHAMGIEHSQKGFDECLLLLSQPSPQGVRLLLYDNVDDPEIDLSPLLPTGNSCAITITSRNHLLGVPYPEQHLRLDSMSPDEAVQLLLHRSNPDTITKQERKEAPSLAKALGYLPIALQQARSYMQQVQCSASAYLDRLSSNHKLLGKVIRFQIDMQSISTYAAFETSFGMLAPRTQKFLRLFSYFHWSNFPLELVVLAAKYQFSQYQRTYIDHGDEFHSGKRMLEDIFLCEGQWDLTNLDEMTVALQNYSLMTILPGVDTNLLHMHPLVHEWLQSCIPVEERSDYRSAAILLLAMGARDDYTASMQYLGSHATHMSPLWNDLHVNNAGAFGSILSKNGIIQSALELQERVVGDLREQLPPNDIKLSDSIWELASSYTDAGRSNEAEQLQKEVLELMKETFGERHPDTITAFNNLAATYYSLGRLEEAKVLQEEVMNIKKEILGERHPDTISASNNLANTYHSLGRLEDAKALKEEVVKMRKEILGERHPDTISASHNLAWTYYGLGRLEDAKMLQEEVLKMRKEFLGERHPDTITASNNLALTYCDLGRLKDAKVLLEEVVKMRKEILGEHHHETAMAMCNLAITYISFDKKDTALELLNTAEHIIAETLGVTHPTYTQCQQIKSNTRKMIASTD